MFKDLGYCNSEDWEFVILVFGILRFRKSEFGILEFEKLYALGKSTFGKWHSGNRTVTSICAVTDSSSIVSKLSCQIPLTSCGTIKIIVPNNI
ncbi:hypothetical protein RCL_jg9327.t1 [Rhizophagus clarus]|uniref:Uncharacterized protein n=1 Tax=Rhizophagus clarus TaxID=94130 RepID=A0A8H3R3X0_9GLOM|nr:hypothetical protein RCL_jg9327.t1 [Rhizophagus clarus]